MLSSVPGVISVQPSDGTDSGEITVTVEAEPKTDVRPALARAVLEKGWDLTELRQLHLSLEDVFIDLVTEESRDNSVKESESETEVAS
ncbi:MAG: hypothetical protein FJY85_14120 [Deltaproteobacteria bacterium]|nr:hypothetical protein [Deltaproteobacteria bacterium]